MTELDWLSPSDPKVFDLYLSMLECAACKRIFSGSNGVNIESPYPELQIPYCHKRSVGTVKPTKYKTLISAAALIVVRYHQDFTESVIGRSVGNLLAEANWYDVCSFAITDFGKKSLATLFTCQFENPYARSTLYDRRVCSYCLGQGDLQVTEIYSSRSDREPCTKCAGIGVQVILKYDDKGVRELATEIYEDSKCGRLDNARMSILADWLRDIGCPEQVPQTCARCLPYVDAVPEDLFGKGGPGYVEMADPASGRYDGGWTNCKVCNGSPNSLGRGKVLATNPLLVHLRSQETHYQGCYVIDALKK